MSDLVVLYPVRAYDVEEGDTIRTSGLDFEVVSFDDSTGDSIEFRVVPLDWTEDAIPIILDRDEWVDILGVDRSED